MEVGGSHQAKKMLCRHWATKGKCDLGTNCKFAHGTSELQQPNLPANFKSKLCNSFLANKSCPNGARCHFAHGQMEVRNVFRGVVGGGWGGPPPIVGGGGWGGGPPVMMGMVGGKAKTVLCKNWKEEGECPFGDKCNFAHGEEQIRGMSGQPPPPGEPESREQVIARNPLYKTTMCKQYAEAEFCELGEECHFAHGQDELRTVGSLSGNPGKVGPHYKTTICKGWAETGACQYGRLCLFAHGPADVRAGGGQQQQLADQQYKTALCKNWESEGKCQWGEQCKWAHGREDLASGRSVPPAPTGPQAGPKMSSPQYKTVLCQQFSEGGHCSFGETCSFAHGLGELRTVQQNLSQLNPHYKGTLCKFFMSTGECEFGSVCQYAHGNMELKSTGFGGNQMKQGNQNYNSMSGVAGLNSPQYKTTLCKNYQDTGRCDFASRCQFAHGQLELRTLAQNYLFLNPQYKTSMCSHFMEGGSGNCPQAHNCQYSHGPHELRPSSGQANGDNQYRGSGLASGGGQYKTPAGPHLPTSNQSQYGSNMYTHQPAGGVHQGSRANRQSSFGGGAPSVPGYKTQLCKNIRERGQCSYGTACQFAHGPEELASSGVGGGGGGGGGGVTVGNQGSGKPVKVVMCEKMNQSGHCDRGAFCDFAHTLQELQLNRARQVPNYKTTLCKSFTASGSCEYGEMCMYAHGSHQLRKMRPSLGTSSFSGIPDPKRFKM